MMQVRKIYHTQADLDQGVVQRCFAARMTATEAARVCQSSAAVLEGWARARGLFWAVRVLPSIVAESDLPPLPPLVARDVCAVACRTLWATLLADQWNLAFGAHCGATDAKDRAAARDWFGTRDCATVCALAGVEPAFVARRFKAAQSGAAFVPKRRYRAGV